jgi:hypothetical protein
MSDSNFISQKEFDRVKAELLEKSLSLEKKCQQLQTQLEKKMNIQDLAMDTGLWCYSCEKVIREDYVCEQCKRFICDVDHYSIYDSWESVYFCGKTCLKKYVSTSTYYDNDYDQYPCLDRYNKR